MNCQGKPRPCKHCRALQHKTQLTTLQRSIFFLIHASICLSDGIIRCCNSACNKCFVLCAAMQRHGVACVGVGQLGLPEARAAERHPNAEPFGRGALPEPVLEVYRTIGQQSTPARNRVMVSLSPDRVMRSMYLMKNTEKFLKAMQVTVSVHVWSFWPC